MSSAVTVGQTGEHALLDRIRRRLPPNPDYVRLGVGDDAAIIAPERNALEVMTADAIVEGVHFERGLVVPADIGYRALAVNLSDIAAMGATPRAALLSMGLPPSLPLTDFDAILDGLLALATATSTSLVGGNLTRSPGPLWIDVTVTGSVHPRRALCRHRARPGDALFLSGQAGAAAAGLAWLRAQGSGPDAGDHRAAVDEAIARYRRPEPRVRLGVLVGRSQAASACIDLSDGLADAVHQLVTASGVSAEIDAEAIPVHEGATALWGAAALEAALRSDDYELLFAVPRRARRALLIAAQRARVPVTQIGLVGKGSGITMRRAGSSLAWPPGYAHFGP